MVSKYREDVLPAHLYSIEEVLLYLVTHKDIVKNIVKDIAKENMNVDGP